MVLWTGTIAGVIKQKRDNENDLKHVDSSDAGKSIKTPNILI